MPEGLKFTDWQLRKAVTKAYPTNGIKIWSRQETCSLETFDQNSQKKLLLLLIRSESRIGICYIDAGVSDFIFSLMYRR